MCYNLGKMLRSGDVVRYVFHSTNNDDVLRKLYKITQKDQLIITQPTGIKELLNAGMTSSEVKQYIGVITNLYSVVLTKDCAMITKTWQSFMSFCVQHKLCPEFVDDDGVVVPKVVPHELLTLDPLYQHKDHTYAWHLMTIDEFRAVVERCIACIPGDWYLRATYGFGEQLTDNGDVDLYYDDDGAPVSRLIKKDRLESVQLSVAVAEADYRVHLCSAFNCCIDDSWNKKWFAGYYKSLDEIATLKNSSEVLQMSLCDTDSVGDDTLYIYERNLVCLNENHNCVPVTAILSDIYGDDIFIPAQYCKQCKKVFVNYHRYNAIRERYKVVLGNMRMVKNGEYTGNENVPARESPLMLCGYRVGWTNGLNKFQRQEIIRYCLESGAVSAYNLENLLNLLINVNGAKSDNDIAVKEWTEDYEFISVVKNSDEPKYHNHKNRYIFEEVAPRFSLDEIPKLINCDDVQAAIMGDDECAKKIKPYWDALIENLHSAAFESFNKNNDPVYTACYKIFAVIGDVNGDLLRNPFACSVDVIYSLAVNIRIVCGNNDFCKIIERSDLDFFKAEFEKMLRAAIVRQRSKSRDEVIAAKEIQKKIRYERRKKQLQEKRKREALEMRQQEGTKNEQEN